MLHLKIKETMEKCRGLDVVESLQNSENDAIYKQVRQVLSYWECVDEDQQLRQPVLNFLGADNSDQSTSMDETLYDDAWQSHCNSSALMSY